MIPTNPVASDDDGFDFYEDIPPLVYVGPLDDDVSPYNMII
jgi:hypothetical protein